MQSFHFVRLIPVLALLLAFVSQQAPLHAQAESLSPLVDVEWLEQHLADHDLRIIDLSHRRKNYNDGHIPGAIFVDWRHDIIDQDHADLYLMPRREQFEKLMGRIGATADSRLVLTDNMESRASIRMYLTLRYFGHDRVSVLNGGTNAWKAAGGLIETDPPEVKETTYVVREVRQEFLSEMQEVMDAIVSRNVLLLDSRSPDQFTGESPGKIFHTGREHRRRGHIETAINISWTEHFNEDGTFKSLAELRSLYSDKGVSPDDEVVTYCNEGLHATIPWFVLHELLGRKDVSVYEHSLGEWANRNETPMAEGDR